GMGRFDDKAEDLFFISSRRGGFVTMINPGQYSISGYWPKKVVHFENVISASTYNRQLYPWPIMRLASLYLYLAEAINEYEGPSEEAHRYVNLVRGRAGLESVEQAWTHFSTKPDKFL